MDYYIFLIDLFPVTIYTYRAGGNFEVSYASKSLTRVTGYELKDFTANQSLWGDNIHPDDKDRVLRALPILFERGMLYHDYRWKIADGTYKWFGDVSRLIKTPEGNARYLVRTWQQITDTRLMSEELHKFNEALEQKIIALSSRLEASNTELKITNDKPKDVIDLLNAENWRLERNTEDFDIYDVIQEAAAFFKKDMDRKGIELKVNVCRIMMHTDRQRLLQCMLSLLSNAVKFTEKGSIRIQSNIYKIQNLEFVKILIEDRGIGIKKEDMPKLFQPFCCLDNLNGAKLKGRGLGLYITRNLVAEVLKGDITAASEYAKGSRFVIWIPAEINSS